MTSRLTKIVDFSYDRLRAKINGGRIIVENEASLQLHFSAILKTVGELFEAHRHEIFSIELEKPVSFSGRRFNKSGTEKAKIDVFLCMDDGRQQKRETCAIELKFFKKENHREPNNRYDIFKDISNLERYSGISDEGFLIAATDHPHYVNQRLYSPDTSDFDLRHGKNYISNSLLTYRTAKPYGPPLSLGGSYDFIWDEFAGGLHFMKLQVNPIVHDSNIVLSDPIVLVDSEPDARLGAQV